jgi:hypothetical protein
VLAGDHTNQTRGFHRCDICGEQDSVVVLDSGERLMLGSAEIWIPGNGLIYAAPTLIYHYIERHAYLPPAAFIESLSRFDPDTFDGQTVLDRLVSQRRQS